MRKGIVGLVILICVFVAVVMSSRGIAVDISQEERLAQIEKRITEAETRLGKIETEYGKIIATLEFEKIKPVAKLNALPAINKSTAQLSPAVSKTAISHAEAGQTVYMNASGTKFHFWDGCTWFGAGDPTTLELALSQEAKECVLCQTHKIIKQK